MAHYEIKFACERHCGDSSPALAAGCTVGPHYHPPAAAHGHDLHPQAAANRDRQCTRAGRCSAEFRYGERISPRSGGRCSTRRNSTAWCARR